MGIWDGAFLIGVLLIASGFLMVQHQLVTAKTDQEARASGGEIICGSAKGLLCMSGSYIWIRADKAGNLGKAWVVKSGMVMPARVYTCDLSGHNIQTMQISEQSDIPAFALNACRAAQNNYRRLAEFQERKMKRQAADG